MKTKKKAPVRLGPLERRRAFDLKAKAYGRRDGLPMAPGEAQFISDMVDEVGPGKVIWFYNIASHDKTLPPSRAMRYVRAILNKERNHEFVKYGSEENIGEELYDLQAAEVYLEQGRLKKARALIRSVSERLKEM